MTSEHRERLIAAMATSVAERGYADTTVADVVRIARTSRRSFYEHFEDRADCFLALFDTTNDVLIAAVTEAVDSGESWEGQVDQALGAFIDAVAANPGLHRSFVRELPALGARGVARQLAVIERFAERLVALVELGRREQPTLGAGPLPFDVAVMIVGGVRELMVIAEQQGRDVRELRPAIAETVNAVIGSAVVRA